MVKGPRQARLCTGKNVQDKKFLVFVDSLGFEVEIEKIVSNTVHQGAVILPFFYKVDMPSPSQCSIGPKD